MMISTWSRVREMDWSRCGVPPSSPVYGRCRLVGAGGDSLSNNVLRVCTGIITVHKKMTTVKKKTVTCSITTLSNDVEFIIKISPWFQIPANVL